MALSDCPKCWDTPCTCGYYWSHLDKTTRIKQAAAVLGIEEEELWCLYGIIPEAVKK